MRRIKITTFLTLAAVSASLFIFSPAPFAKGRSLKIDPSEAGSITAAFVNIGGMEFQPGQSLEIKWLLQGEGVRFFETHPWSECELFFSEDGGKTWLRISPHLGVVRRSYEWMVPNVATREGMLSLQIGIEGDAEFFVFPSERFTVLPGSR